MNITQEGEDQAKCFSNGDEYFNALVNNISSTHNVPPKLWRVFECGVVHITPGDENLGTKDQIDAYLPKKTVVCYENIESVDECHETEFDEDGEFLRMKLVPGYSLIYFTMEENPLKVKADFEEMVQWLNDCKEYLMDRAYAR